MDLLSIFRREPASSTPAKRSRKAASDAQETLQRLRQQARRRLMGAAVLVGVGVIAFPLLFETQPRPVPMDLPIVIPAREATTNPVPAAQAPVTGSLPDDAEVQAAADAASLPEPSPLPERSSAPLAPPEAERKSEAKVAKVAKVANVAAEPAKPVLKPAPPSATEPSAARFVVQVGAFADKQAAQLARKKLERQGLKTYAQVAKTAQGDRIRVRLGPFASRAEADRAAQKAKAAGLAGAVLAL